MMTTDLEDSLRAALASRGAAITVASLRRPAPPLRNFDQFDTHGTDVTLVRHERSRRSTRAAVIWSSAAAMLAALLTIAVVALRPLSHGTQSSAGGAGPILSLPFDAHLPAGFRITTVLSDDDGQLEVVLFSGEQEIHLTVDPPGGANRRFRSDARPITIDRRPGFVGATWTDPQYDSHNTDLPATSVSWKYNGIAYASLDAPESSIRHPNLEMLASAFDFTGETPIRVAVQLHSLPAKTRVTGVDSIYEDLDPHPDSPWDSRVTLSLTGSPRDGIEVSLCRCAYIQPSKSARRITINGRLAYVQQFGQDSINVQVVEPAGSRLIVSSTHDIEGGERWTGTLSMLLDIARSVTITPHPNSPHLWFTAMDAVPAPTR